MMLADLSKRAAASEGLDMACDFDALDCKTFFSWPQTYLRTTYNDIDKLVETVLTSSVFEDVLPCRNPVEGVVGLYCPKMSRVWIIPVEDLSEEQQELAASPQGTARLFDREE